jgi:Ca2+-binding RTX toxin-like protein
MRVRAAIRLGLLSLAAVLLGTPAQAMLPIGPQFRVSQMGPDGNTTFGAFSAAIAYNPQANQFLVVWSGADTTVGEREIWGRLVDTAGNPLGGNFRISDMGPDGDANYDAFNPAVTYNAQANEYLVVWSGDDNTAPLVEAEFEIFGQRLSASGTEVGTNDSRLSDMGPDGNVSYGAFNPAVTYNAQANEYLVVWSGDDNTAPLVEAEFEIFGQRLSASGTETGTNDFRLSDMGPDGNANYDVSSPSVAYNDQANEYLVVWSGDDDTAPLVDNETEIFGQRLSASGTETGTNDFRLSQMGPDGNASFAGENPAVIYGTAPNEYLVVWSGDDNTAPLVDEEFEIFGQRLATSGTELDTNDFRISVMGPDGATTYGALNSAVAYNEQANEYLVAWEGDTDAAPLVDDELEIWARRSGAGPPAPCTITGTPGNDVITGTAGDDRICARGGNDRVFGRGGNDRIVLGPGRDRAFGGPGRDVILGGKGPDRISGGGGRDRLFGERGRDVLFARDRVRDLVHGGRGFDRARVDRRRDTRRSIERLF